MFGSKVEMKIIDGNVRYIAQDFLTGRKAFGATRADAIRRLNDLIDSL